ncbi:uncharacterized protein LOC132637678 [Lycium barbarum]|uniref:uncharacterized protein LOC132637678 n=1 Tax=Lycium barbarum TaxID=112863 RepID=UPI00293E7300|nr:uncharacterized protein LOC132637678 [Lycium barbarum]
MLRRKNKYIKDKCRVIIAEVGKENTQKEGVLVQNTFEALREEGNDASTNEKNGVVIDNDKEQDTVLETQIQVGKKARKEVSPSQSGLNANVSKYQVDKEEQASTDASGKDKQTNKEFSTVDSGGNKSITKERQEIFDADTINEEVMGNVARASATSKGTVAEGEQAISKDEEENIKVQMLPQSTQGSNRSSRSYEVNKAHLEKEQEEEKMSNSSVQQRSSNKVSQQVNDSSNKENMKGNDQNSKQVNQEIQQQSGEKDIDGQSLQQHFQQT